MSNKTTVTICCPMCKGAGKITAPIKSVRAEQMRIAKALHRQGFSIARITALMGYRSKRSAWLLIKAKN